jgi:hypothetical protein
VRLGYDSVTVIGIVVVRHRKQFVHDEYVTVLNFRKFVIPHHVSVYEIFNVVDEYSGITVE